MIGNALLIAIFAFVVALVAIAIFQSSTQYQNQQYSQTRNERTEKTANEDESWEALWQRTKTDPIAFFTAVLEISTTALFVLGLLQIWFLNKAENTARRCQCLSRGHH